MANDRNKSRRAKLIAGARSDEHPLSPTSAVTRQLGEVALFSDPSPPQSSSGALNSSSSVNTSRSSLRLDVDPSSDPKGLSDSHSTGMLDRGKAQLPSRMNYVKGTSLESAQDKFGASSMIRLPLGELTNTVADHACSNFNSSGASPSKLDPKASTNQETEDLQSFPTMMEPSNASQELHTPFSLTGFFSQISPSQHTQKRLSEERQKQDLTPRLNYHHDNKGIKEYKNQNTPSQPSSWGSSPLQALRSKSETALKTMSSPMRGAVATFLQKLQTPSPSGSPEQEGGDGAPASQRSEKFLSTSPSEGSPTSKVRRGLQLGLRIDTSSISHVAVIACGANTGGATSSQIYSEKNQLLTSDLASLDQPRRLQSPPKHGRNSPSGPNDQLWGGMAKKLRFNADSSNFPFSSEQPTCLSPSKLPLDETNMDISDDSVMPTVPDPVMLRCVSDSLIQPLVPYPTLSAVSSAVSTPVSMSPLTARTVPNSVQRQRHALPQRRASQPQEHLLDSDELYMDTRTEGRPKETEPGLQGSVQKYAALCRARTQSGTMPSVTKEFLPHKPVLPPATPGDTNPIKRISSSTVAAVLRGDYAGQLHRVYILDCRYDYEYNGGHIEGALHMDSRERLERFFMEKMSETTSPLQKLGVVFHCEFSKHRGPIASRIFRVLDRQMNESSYPFLSFPEVVVLDGGYRDFHNEYPDFCTPRAYVSMWDRRFAQECKDRHKQHKLSWGSCKNQGYGTQNKHRARVYRKGSRGRSSSTQVSLPRSTASSPGLGLTPMDIQSFNVAFEEPLELIQMQEPMSAPMGHRRILRNACVSPSARNLFSSDSRGLSLDVSANFGMSNGPETCPPISNEEVSMFDWGGSPTGTSQEKQLELLFPSIGSPATPGETTARARRSSSPNAASEMSASNELKEQKDHQRLKGRLLSGTRGLGLQATRGSRSHHELPSLSDRPGPASSRIPLSRARSPPASMPSFMPASPQFCPCQLNNSVQTGFGMKSLRPCINCAEKGGFATNVFPPASTFSFTNSPKSSSATSGLMQSSQLASPTNSFQHRHGLTLVTNAASHVATELSPLGEHSVRNYIPTRRASAFVTRGQGPSQCETDSPVGQYEQHFSKASSPFVPYETNGSENGGGGAVLARSPRRGKLMRRKRSESETTVSPSSSGRSPLHQSQQNSSSLTRPRHASETSKIKLSSGGTHTAIES
eukprot:gb/GEZN01000616.1/.p1 GENE.gb/GEZN01000616.1/~~gb/GEZN01000616.1/.p1  ORF type:complete len:1201 (-),score=100.41 gb/GEZN01000616.1/:111-3713(-)